MVSSPVLEHAKRALNGVVVEELGQQGEEGNVFVRREGDDQSQAQAKSCGAL